MTALTACYHLDIDFEGQLKHPRSRKEDLSWVGGRPRLKEDRGLNNLSVPVAPRPTCGLLTELRGLCFVGSC